MKMAMIVAMDEDGCIGRENNLPWRLKSDMVDSNLSLKRMDSMPSLWVAKLGIRFLMHINRYPSVSIS